jgi:hypothetical protein
MQTAKAPSAAARATARDEARESGGALGGAASPARESTVSDPTPLDFLLDLPGSSALAATTSFDTKVFR